MKTPNLTKYAQIRAMLTEGKKWSEICRELHCSMSTITAALRHTTVINIPAISKAAVVQIIETNPLRKWSNKSVQIYLNEMLDEVRKL